MKQSTLIAADTPELLAEVAALANVIWRHHYTPIIGHDQVEYMLAEGYNPDALAAQRDSGTSFFLARTDERFIAYAACSPDSTNPETAWLDKLYVHIDARRCGIASALVNRIVREAGTFGATTLKLRVNRHNTDSIAAYEKLGFETESTDIKDIGNGFVMDDYIMAAPLARLIG